MPLPFFLIAAAIAAGATGVGAGIHGGIKMKEAKDTMEYAESRNASNKKRFEQQTETTNKDMDALGESELKILNSFEEFSNLIEMIQNRPKFIQYDREGVELPEYNPEELKRVSIGAGVLMGSLSGAAMGTAGGFAAAGMTTAAVAALGVASTGTPIAALSGAAAVNATLAALGGGAIAAGGGGIALGTTVLGASTLGIGLLVGGIIFNIAGSSMSDKADKAYDEMKRAEKEIDRICNYLVDLSEISHLYIQALQKVDRCYRQHLSKLAGIVDLKQNWDEFSESEKEITENTVLLVGLLYKMCKVQIVLQSDDEKELNYLNHKDVADSVITSTKFLEDRDIGSEEQITEEDTINVTPQLSFSILSMMSHKIPDASDPISLILHIKSFITHYPLVKHDLMNVDKNIVDAYINTLRTYAKSDAKLFGIVLTHICQIATLLKYPIDFDSFVADMSTNSDEDIAILADSKVKYLLLTEMFMLADCAEKRNDAHIETVLVDLAIRLKVSDDELTLFKEMAETFITNNFEAYIPHGNIKFPGKEYTEVMKCYVDAYIQKHRNIRITSYSDRILCIEDDDNAIKECLVTAYQYIEKKQCIGAFYEKVYAPASGIFIENKHGKFLTITDDSPRNNPYMEDLCDRKKYYGFFGKLIHPFDYRQENHNISKSEAKLHWKEQCGLDVDVK